LANYGFGSKFSHCSFCIFYKKVDTKTIEYSDLVSEASSKYNLVEVGNLSNAVQLVVLPDGSSVILKKGSKLSYPNHFSDDSREIYLTGEAFLKLPKTPLNLFMCMLMKSLRKY